MIALDGIIVEVVQLSSADGFAVDRGCFGAVPDQAGNRGLQDSAQHQDDDQCHGDHKGQGVSLCCLLLFLFCALLFSHGSGIELLAEFLLIRSAHVINSSRLC